MAYSKKEREEYNRYRGHVNKELGVGKNEYNALRRVSHELRKHNENYANGRKDNESKEYGEKEHSRDVGKSFAKAEAIRRKKKLGVHFYHQTDPRGAALHIAKERMSDRDYSSKGKPVY